MSGILKKFVEEIMAEIQQEESELEEMSTTGNVAGYNTPHAFKKTDGTDEDDEPNSSYVDKLNQSTGYKRVDENRWHELAKSDGTPKQKIGVGIRNINKQLSEMEQFINWYGKLKNESGMDSTDHWKRTKNHLFKIRERLSRISTSISKL
jgi:division protein CdvB (Snf7/Vps24/ESCRT-III family)